MYNNAGVVDLIQQVAGELLGEQNVQPPVKNMGAEDFGFFSDLAPGAMFYLGCRIENDERIHHHPLFDINEACLPYGAAILVGSALRLMVRRRSISDVIPVITPGLLALDRPFSRFLFRPLLFIQIANISKAFP